MAPRVVGTGRSRTIGDKSMVKVIGVTEHLDLNRSIPLNTTDTHYYYQLHSSESWLIQRIYVDRVGSGSNDPVDWGNVFISIIYKHGPVFEAHLSDIGRSHGDLGDKIAKLLDEYDPTVLLQRLGADPSLFMSRVVGILRKPFFLEQGTLIEINLKGQLDQNVRLCFSGICKRDCI